MPICQSILAILTVSSLQTSPISVECDSVFLFFFFFSSRRRHTRFDCDWSSDVCSSDLLARAERDCTPWGLRPRGAQPTVGERGGSLQPTPLMSPEPTQSRSRAAEIGRASCRERG